MPFPALAVGDLITLRDGGSELVVAPECGARLVAFRAEGRDVLRPASDDALRSAAAYGFAAFPLVPYSGPIFGGGFRFRGQWHPLARNVAAEPSATHGEGWIRPWRIAAADNRSMELAIQYEPAADAFPFAWRGRLRLAVSAGSPAGSSWSTATTGRCRPGWGCTPISPRRPARSCGSTALGSGRRMRRRPWPRAAGRSRTASTSRPAAMSDRSF